MLESRNRGGESYTVRKMGETSFTLIEGGGIAGKEVFGKKSGLEWAVRWASDYCQKLVLKLAGPLASVGMSILWIIAGRGGPSNGAFTF